MFELMWFLLFIFLFVLFVVMICKERQTFKPYMGDVVNYDTFGRKFVYAVQADRATVLERLSLRLATDKPDYRFDAAQGSLTLSKDDQPPRYRYRVEIIEEAERTIVRVERAKELLGGALPYYVVNGFIIEKLGAEPIAYFPRPEE